MCPRAGVCVFTCPSPLARTCCYRIDITEHILSNRSQYKQINKPPVINDGTISILWWTTYWIFIILMFNQVQFIAEVTINMQYHIREPSGSKQSQRIFTRLSVRLCLFVPVCLHVQNKEATISIFLRYVSHIISVAQTMIITKQIKTTNYLSFV